MPRARTRGVSSGLDRGGRLWYHGVRRHPMDVLSGPGLNGVEWKCKHCGAQLRLCAGDLKVNNHAAGPSVVAFRCDACKEENRLPNWWGKGPSLTQAEAFNELKRRVPVIEPAPDIILPIETRVRRKP